MAWFYQSRTQILGFYWSIISKNNFRTHKNSKFGVLLMKLSQSNFNLRSPDCYLVHSYLITTVTSNFKWKIFSNFVAFSEYPTFTPNNTCLKICNTVYDIFASYLNGFVDIWWREPNGPLVMVCKAAKSYLKADIIKV